MKHRRHKGTGAQPFPFGSVQSVTGKNTSRGDKSISPVAGVTQQLHCPLPIELLSPGVLVWVKMNKMASDPRPDTLKSEMAYGFEKYEEEYREGGEFGTEVVYEDDEMVIVADHGGHELNEYLNGYDLGRDNMLRGDILRWMTDVARDKTEYAWGSADPILFDKLD